MEPRVMLVAVLLVVASAASGVHARRHRNLRDATLHGADQSPSATIFLQTAAKVSMPAQCEAMKAMHGQTAIDNWFMAVAELLPRDTPEDVCTKALDCKRLLGPLITADNKYKRPCPSDCSGNGVCLNGLCSCEPGYSGDACDKMRCPGNCSGRGRCKLGRCFCEPGFSGDNCEKIADCPMYASQPCAGHGTCDRGVCFCDPGFTGPSCDKVARCPGDCSNRGLCIHGKCFCSDNWGGPDCSVEEYSDKCPNDCTGKGECVRGRCRCVDGHFGEDCSSAVECPKHDGAYCSGHGSCNNGRCQCYDGYVGFTCSIKQECPGNGTCSARGLCLDGKCYCYAGYSGSACDQTSPCANGCSDRGVCSDGKCLCMPGFYGVDCSKGRGTSVSQRLAQEAAAAACNCSANGTAAAPGEQLVLDQQAIQKLQAGSAPCPNACSGTGVCLNGTCACLPGFGGGDCSQVSEVMACPNRCNFKGVCLMGHCKCLPPYGGADCSEIKSRKLRARLAPGACPNQCSGHGDCWNGTCVCHPGYASHDCSLEIPCKDNCNGVGICDRGRCFCYPGFEGASCEVASRCPNGCSGQGLCFYGKCFCNSYYSGEDCSKTPHCPKGCAHGVCRGNNLCACDPGWTGVNCSEKIDCNKDCNGPDRGHCFLTASPKCACHGKWGGRFCGRDLSKCPDDCNGRGLCVLGKCQCDAGFAGTSCQTQVGGSTMYEVLSRNLEVNSTQPRFKAVEQGQAASPAAAFGVADKAGADASSAAAAGSSDNDDEDEAAKEEEDIASDGQQPRFRSKRESASSHAQLDCPNGCSKNGLCANGMCFCNPGFTGLDCAQVVNCPNDCSGHGICKYGQCFCEPAYSGSSCAVKVTTSHSFPQGWVTLILASCAFFFGFYVGRKSLAKDALSTLDGASDARVKTADF